jgi:hypothetical protein
MPIVVISFRMVFVLAWTIDVPMVCLVNDYLNFILYLACLVLLLHHHIRYGTTQKAVMEPLVVLISCLYQFVFLRSPLYVWNLF